jgi:hypothetical protein
MTSILYQASIVNPSFLRKNRRAMISKRALASVASGGVFLVCAAAYLGGAYPAMLARLAPDSPAGDSAIVCGSVSHRPWGKTIESWDAGGSDYYAMTMDRSYAATHPSYGGSLILRPSEKDGVTPDELSRWEGRHVCVRGTLQEARPYTPQFAWEQFPIDNDGKPLPRGSGIVVTRLGRLVDVQQHV